MRSSYIQELAADAAEIVSDWGRQVIFKARADLSEPSGTTFVTNALIGDPTLSQELVPGGIQDTLTFEVKVLNNSTLPSSWRPFSEELSWKGRRLTVQGYANDLRVTEVTNKQGSPWAIFKVESANK